jgi:tRNA threonylcarbamoyladenosine biosynthesis protein TsaE
MKKVFSEKDIPKIAEAVIAHIDKKSNKAGATIVTLSGELGAGKTTLTQAIAREFGIKETITSPTFVLMKSYDLKARKWKHMHHIDAYRLDTPEHINALKWNELIANPDNIIFLEWPEQIEGLVPEGAISIKLSHKDETKREIDIQ